MKYVIVKAQQRGNYAANCPSPRIVCSIISTGVNVLGGIYPNVITVDSNNTAKYYPSPLPVEFQYISYMIELISNGVVWNKYNRRAKRAITYS